MNTHPFFAIDSGAENALIVFAASLGCPCSTCSAVAELAGYRVEACLDSQTMAALGAASGDNLATTLGSHTNKETMGTLAANHGRLVGAFHILSLELWFDAEKRVIRNRRRLFVKKNPSGVYQACG